MYGPLDLISTRQTYQHVTKDISRTLNVTASKAGIKREIKYYLDTIEGVKTIDQFVNNRRLFSFAMKAFGLEDMTYAKAFVKKALVEGIQNKNSFANRLVDTRLREFVRVFDFARRGEFTTTFVETQQGTVDKYVRQVLEEDTGLQSEGARLALYFERKAPTIDSAYSILADKALLRVVQTALDIPASAAMQDIDKQAATIAERMSIGSLSSKEGLSKFMDKFLTKWDLANTPQSAASTLLPLGSAGSIGIGSSTLAALQNLRIGG